MTTPKHRTAPGASYFVTTKCAHGRSVFQIPEVAVLMIEILFRYRDCGIYLLHEFVVMPDHLHLILTPSSSNSVEKSLQMIKGGSSFEIHKLRQQKMEIWQSGFYDWTIRDGSDWQIKADYVRLNPVRALLVEKAEDWPYSSSSGKFYLDAIPQNYSQLASGAKAPVPAAATPELKLRPPEETANATANATAVAKIAEAATAKAATGEAARAVAAKAEGARTEVAGTEEARTERARTEGILGAAVNSRLFERGRRA